VKNGTFAGRIGADAETRKAGDDQTVTNFNVAADRPKKNGEKQKPLWVKAALWGKRGQVLEQYLTKGTTVCIVGDIDIETYKNREGEVVSQIVCRVGDVTLLGGNTSEREPGEEKQQAAF
jgi:single-strand DNA-binding protein